MSITKGAADPDRFRRPTFSYGSARQAFRDFLAHASADPHAGVLLPAFIGWSPREGSGVFDPVDALGLPANFYGLHRDLTADVDDLARRLASGRYRAVVVIHYYGRTDPGLQHIAELARTQGVPLVEDNAHAFFSAHLGGVAGSAGDVSLYSLHKMFPVPDGGVAVYRDNSRLNGQASAAPEPGTQLLAYDWRAISEARRRNFALATRLVRAAQGRGMPVELVWPDLADTDVPQTLPLYVLTDDRDALYERLNTAGFGVVSLYHTLIPQLRTGFPVSAWAAAHILNLPVHQDVDPQELERLVAAMERELGPGPNE